MTKYKVQGVVEMATVEITVWADSEQEAADKAQTSLEGGTAVFSWGDRGEGSVLIDAVSRLSADEET